MFALFIITLVWQMTPYSWNSYVWNVALKITKQMTVVKFGKLLIPCLMYLKFYQNLNVSMRLYWLVKWKLFSRVRLFATPWAIESMEFSRPEYWSEYPFFSTGDLPKPGIKPRSPTLEADSLPPEPQGKPKNTGVGSLSLLQWIFPTQELNRGLLHCRWILYQLRYQGSQLARTSIINNSSKVCWVWILYPPIHACDDLYSSWWNGCIGSLPHEFWKTLPDSSIRSVNPWWPSAECGYEHGHVLSPRSKSWCISMVGMFHQLIWCCEQNGAGHLLSDFWHHSCRWCYPILTFNFAYSRYCNFRKHDHFLWLCYKHIKDLAL